MTNGKPKILVVDDEKGLRDGTKRLLESEDYIVDVAENGKSGIELGLKNDYDIAIIDMKMPDIEGLEVLQQLKSSKPNTVYFIATAYASYDTAIESTRLGAFNYIPKPFAPEELLHQVQQGYRQRQILVESENLRKEREESLLEIAHEKSRLKTVIESISSGVLLINKDAEVVYYNHATLQKLNLDEIQIGENIINKLPKPLAEIAEKFLSSNKYESKSITIQLEILPKGELYVDATCSPIKHPDGSFAGIVIILKNITTFKKVEQIKNQFVSMVAHELKTPVAAVQGYLKILLDETLNISKEKSKEYLERSSIRLQGLLDLVNDLLDISRMETGTKQREIKELDVTEIIQNSLTFLEFELEKKKIKISSNLPPDLPKLHADQSEISRILINLLSNGIKYNRSGGELSISASVQKSFIVIEIADTGIGLKPEEKEKLFHEFYRVKNEFTKNISGTGLGLSIVKRIVESYHGKIEVESEFQKGTTFKIYLPTYQ